MLDNGLVVFAAIFIRAVRSACDSTNKKFLVVDVKKLTLDCGPDKTFAWGGLSSFILRLCLFLVACVNPGHAMENPFQRIWLASVPWPPQFPYRCQRPTS